ncbi:MAG: hydroxyacid dehydrogenase [Betaproteobacteria bacterium]|nr:hydroxyacid dehydrogenase [Betaproteobacteria bacterium]
MKIAILDDYQQIALNAADWKSLPAGTEVKSFAQYIPSQAEVIKQLAPFDVIIAMRERTRFSAEVIDALPNLRLLVSTGARNASIDSKACERRKIALSGAQGTKHAQSSTSEVAWGLILALTKKMPQSEKSMRSGGWQETVMTESLSGKTLGVLGLGRLGQYVAKYGQAFGMSVIAWSPNLTPERTAEFGVRHVSKDALFAQADIISVHMVLAAATRGIVGAADIARMKPTAYIVNTSRGPLIDEQALMDALKEKRIGGAGLDVFWSEPLASDHPLRRLDNVVLTPHVGYVVDDNMKMFYENALKNIKHWLAGEPMTPLK